MEKTHKQFSHEFRTPDGMRDAIAGVINTVAATARQCGKSISDKTRHAINLLFTEAWSNHIRHGHKSNYNLAVTVRGEVLQKGDDLKLRVQSEDQGSGFTVSSIPLPKREDETGKGVKTIRDFAGRLGGAIRYNPKGNAMTIDVNIQEPDYHTMFAPAVQEVESDEKNPTADR